MQSQNYINKRVILLGFWTMFAVIFCLTAYKAFTVPITHDEAWTVIQYLDHSVWDIMMYPDNWPNNHILNTLLAKLSASIFGVHDWSVRLPNLLFFWVFAYGVYRFLMRVFQERYVLILPVGALFILSPYFIDFFALCRGYGISSALTMLSLSYVVDAFLTGRERYIWLGFLTALLASYANFTVLIYFGAITCVLPFFLIVNRLGWRWFIKRLSTQILIIVAYAALIYEPIYKMKSTNQFEFWSSNGFYEETVFSIVHNSLTDSSLYTRHEWFAQLTMVLAFFLWGFALFIFVKQKTLGKALRHPVVVVGMVLLITVLINLAQTNLLGDPNLNGRTALFLLPIFIALVAAGIRSIPFGKRKWTQTAFVVLLMLVFIQHWGMSYRSQSFKEWRYDQYTLDVIEIVEREEKKGATLKVDWFFQNSFEFYQKYAPNSDWKLLLGDHGNNVTDFYYLPEITSDSLLSDYQVIRSFEGGQVLLKRK